MVKLSRKQRKFARRIERKKQIEPSEEKTQEVTRIAPRHQYTGILGFFERKYKPLLIIPFLILFLALFQITAQTITTGDFINKGVSLSGGMTLIITGQYDIDPGDLELYISQKINDDVAVRILKSTGAAAGFIIDAPENTENEVLSAIEDKIGKIDNSQYTIEQTGSALGASFFRETATALIIAFISMGIVVFLYFRLLVPSGAVMLAAFSDIVVTIAIVNLLGVKLSTGGIAAFLMLIGYSVDTDILLSTRVLKTKTGTIFSRVVDAMKTGLTMSITTLCAVIVGFIFAESETLKQIMLILMIGLIVDVVMTWLQNAGLLRLYFEKVKR